MMRSLYSGVSGLKNHQTRMDVIGNNISNVNTTGFKSSRATFADMISQNLSGASSPQGNVGGVNPKQIGLGSSVAAIDLLFTNGSVQSTGVNTDLCLSSTNALFILDTGNGTAYTRNGDFQFDADGNYVQSGNGYFVQGWMADESGAIDTGANVGTITIPSGKPMAPVASTSAAYTNNLNSEIPMITKITYQTADGNSVTLEKDGADGEAMDKAIVPSGTGDTPISATITLSDGETLTVTAGKYAVGESMPLVTTLTIYGAEGAVHEIPVYFTRTEKAKDINEWRVSLSIDGGDYEFTEADGSITTCKMPPVPLKFTPEGRYDNATNGPITLELTNGEKSGQTVSIDFSALTQYAAGNTVAGKADGNAAGTLASVAIDASGTITGTYTNGMKKAEAQVALQRFNNPGGLEKIGESLYQDSNNAGKSGSPNTAAALGATLTPAALEMSNVDIADQFTDMIITQRGFQANSKIITVSDEMLETLINTKR